MMTFTPPPRLRRLGAVAVLALAFGAATATPALAHTRLVSSTPGKGGTETAVSRVTLTFSDAISVAEVVVRDDREKEFQSGKAERDGATVVQKLKTSLPPGSYTVAYGVVGEDGHRIEKADLTFGVAAPGTVVRRSAGPAPTLTLNATTAATAPGKATAPEKEEASSGASRWLMIVVGAVIGIGIGMVIVFRAKRRHPVPGPRGERGGEAKDEGSRE
jgi:methionine-rich copper-binding protein CopC